MKIMFTRCCQTLVVPYKTANKPRTCECGKSSVWWENPLAGKLKVHTIHDDNYLWVDILCVHNGIFSETGMQAPETYRDKAKLALNSVFAETESMIVLVSAGTTNDVTYATDEEFELLKTDKN